MAENSSSTGADLDVRTFCTCDSQTFNIIKNPSRKNSQTMVFVMFKNEIISTELISQKLIKENRRVVCVQIVRANRLNRQAYINQ